MRTRQPGQKSSDLRESQVFGQVTAVALEVSVALKNC